MFFHYLLRILNTEAFAISSDCGQFRHLKIKSSTHISLQSTKSVLVYIHNLRIEFLILDQCEDTSDNCLPSFTQDRLCNEDPCLPRYSSLSDQTNARRALSTLESRYFRHTSISFVFPHQSRVMGLGTDSMLPIYVAPQSSSRAQQDIILFLMIMVNMQSNESPPLHSDRQKK